MHSLFTPSSRTSNLQAATGSHKLLQRLTPALWQPEEGYEEDVERAKRAAKLMSLSSKWNLNRLPNMDLKAWEIRRSDIHIETRPDGSDWLLGAGAYGKVRS